MFQLSFYKYIVCCLQLVEAELHYVVNWVRQRLFTCSTPSLYLNLWWLTVNWTFMRNKFQWNFNQNTTMFIDKYVFKCVVHKTVSILSMPQCANCLAQYILYASSTALTHRYALHIFPGYECVWWLLTNYDSLHYIGCRRSKHCPTGAFQKHFHAHESRSPSISLLNRIQIFQCIGKIFCVEFQGVPLKFHTKYLAHTLKDMFFLQCHRIQIFQCIGKIFCVEFQRVPLKFHTKYLAHTLIDMIFIQCWKFKSSQIEELASCIFEMPPDLN